MDGVHDMGGMDGFGKVEPEPNEPVFHHRWEGRRAGHEPRHRRLPRLDEQQPLCN